MVDHRKDLVLTDDDIIFFVDFDLGPGVFADQDVVLGFDVQGHALAVVVVLALPDGDDLRLEGFLLRGVGDDDPAADGLLGLDALNENPVVQGLHFHSVTPFMMWGLVSTLWNRVLTRRSIDATKSLVKTLNADCSNIYHNCCHIL